MKVIHNDGSIGVCEGAEELQALRHSSAQLLAQAMRRLDPGAACAGSGLTDHGFYCDFDCGST